MPAYVYLVLDMLTPGLFTARLIAHKAGIAQTQVLNALVWLEYHGIRLTESDTGELGLAE